MNAKAEHSFERNQRTLNACPNIEKNILNPDELIDSNSENNHHEKCISEACMLSALIVDVLTRLAQHLNNTDEAQNKTYANTLKECVRLLQVPWRKSNSIESEIKILEEKGDLYISKNNFDKALSMFTAALKICPPNSRILYKRSICHTNLYNSSDALKDAIKSIDEDSANVNAKIQLVKCYLNIGQIVKAEKVINELLLSNPDSSEALREQNLIQKINLMESKVELILERAKRFMVVGMYEEAESEILRASNNDDVIRLHPKYIKFIADIKSKKK